MTSAAPRRLSPEARRAQLVDEAIALCARDGWEALSLDAVAEAAGVTRGLMYRYFPDGRDDLLTGIAEAGAARLRVDFDTDPEHALDTKTAANLALVLAHAEQRSDAWVVMRGALTSSLPAARAVVDALLDELVAAIALNNLGTDTPSRTAEIAIRGYIALASSVLDDWHDEPGLSRDAVFALLAATFTATMDHLRAAD